MARRTEGLKIRPWATEDDALKLTSEQFQLTRSAGFATETTGTDEFIPVELFNCFINEFSLFLTDLQRTGILEWSANVSENYTVGAIVLGSDGHVYRCGFSRGSRGIDPVEDTTNSNWTKLIQSSPNAGTNSRGVIELATDIELSAGEDSGSTGATLGVTPKQVADYIAAELASFVGDGVVTGISLSGTELTLTRTGDLADIIVDLASLLTGYLTLNNPVFTTSPTVPAPSAGDDSQRIATTAFVRTEGRNVSAQTANTVRKGIAEEGTVDEAIAGTNNTVFVDGAGLGARLATIAGAAGADGADGVGIRGDRGDRGDPGDSIQGPEGDQIQGPKGPKGEQGADGIGIRGDQGDQGPRGQQGNQRPTLTFKRILAIGETRQSTTFDLGEYDFIALVRNRGNNNHEVVRIYNTSEIPTIDDINAPIPTGPEGANALARVLPVGYKIPSFASSDYEFWSYAE